MKKKLLASAVSTMCLLSACGGGDSAPIATPPSAANNAKRVLLLSIDGLHQSDLSNWVRNHPSSSLAGLAANGVLYTSAKTTTPSDSFPGMLALVTGGSPKSTGVYYDDSYDRTLYAPGSNCTGNPGTEVVYDESIDFDSTQLMGGGGINPANLPLRKTASNQCVPVYPHSFVMVNTAFEVVRAAGRLTAWSDKHFAYDLLNGPSGTGIADLYTPEINSNISNGGVVNGVNLAATQAQCDGSNSLPVNKVVDYTTCLPSVMAYDDVKVQAVINQIDGWKSDKSQATGVPALFGMNFQALSVGQKLPVGGYADAQGSPSANLAAILQHTDQSIGKLIAELKAQGLYNSTLIIVSAKHGQSPMDKSKLQMESGGSGTATVQDPQPFVNNQDPNVDTVMYTNNNTTGPTQGKQYATNGHLQTDDVGILWLQNQTPSNIAGVINQLQNNAAAIAATNLPAGTIFQTSINAGAALAGIFGDPTSTDPIAAARAPNVMIQPNYGVIYSGSTKKIAEHGGGSMDDTNVGLLVSMSGMAPSVVSAPVSTTQVAPTILKSLGLDPNSLQAVQKEGTQVLPNLF